MPQINFDEARKFLHWLDLEADSFAFQTADDHRPARNGLAYPIKKGDPANGAFEKLADLNNRGAGVFVTINETDGKRRMKENIKRVRAVFVDLDRAPLEPVLKAPLKPHKIIQSSPGKYHAYWLVGDCPLDQFERVQRALAARFGGDPSVHDLPRVMRLPGFLHRKSKPFVTQVLPDIGSNAGPYALAEIVGTLKLDLSPKSNGVAGGGDGDVGENAASIPSPLDERNAERISAALKDIEPDIDYHQWIKIGQCLHSGDSSPDGRGFKMWLDWSAEGEKFKDTSPDEMARKWAGFHAGRGVTLRTISHISEQYGANKAHRKSGVHNTPPTGESALQLMERDMPKVSYLCDPYIVEGLNITAGRPKIGKTTLARQKLASVAGGTPFFDEPCQQAACAFLCLEEGDRLLKIKLEMADFPRAALANITVFYDWPRGADGVRQLHRMLDERPDIRYVVIDSLTRFRSVPDARTPAFSADYEAVTGLHDVAKARPGVAIDVIHHTRKAKSDDPIEDISGTFGVSAAVDSYWILRRHEDGAVLHIGGRLWTRDTSQYQLARGNQRWTLAGEFTRLTPTQRETLDYLEEAGHASSTGAGRAFRITKQSAHDRLEQLANLGFAYSKAGIYYKK